MKSSGATTCALLLVASTVAAVNAPAASSAEPDPLMFAGAVYAPTAAPVEVTAQVWPDQQTLLELPPGSAVPTIEVPVAVEGNTYQVRLDAGDIPATHRDSNGVEVRVDLQGDTFLDSYAEKLSIADSGRWVRNALVGAQTRRAPKLTLLSGATTPKVPGTLIASDPAVASRGGSVGLRPATLRTTSPKARSAGETDTAMMCDRYRWNKTSTSWSKRVKIGDVMTAQRYMRGALRYKKETKHSIQIAVKMGDTVRAGGNLTVSSYERVDPKAWKGDKVAWTDWRIRKYTRDCAAHWAEARAEHHEGGYYTTARSRPKYTKCKRYMPMNEWDAAEGKAWTYQAGVSIWGASFDAQTGYNDMTELVYKFPHRKRWLCGNNAFPARAQLVAGYGRDQG